MSKRNFKRERNFKEKVKQMLWFDIHPKTGKIIELKSKKKAQRNNE